MHAAVVTSFDAPPSFQEFPDAPTPGEPDEVLVDVVASGLHRRVRSQADGIALHQHRRASAGPGRRRGGPHAGRHVALLRAGRHHVGRDGRTDGDRPAPEFPATRRCRPGAGGGGDEPGDVRMGRAATADRLSGRPDCAGAWAPPAARDRWPSRSRSASARARSSPPGAIRRSWPHCRHSAPTPSCVSASSRPRRGGRRGRRGHRLPVGPGHRRRDDGYRQQPQRRQSPADLDRGRLGRRTDGRDPVGGATGTAPADRRKRARIGVHRALLAELPALVEEISSGALRIDAHAVPLATSTTAWQEADSDARIVLTP